MSIELILACFYGPGNYRMIMNYSSFAFTLIGLFSWIFNWLRLIVKLANEKNGKWIHLIHAGVSLFVLISCVIVIISHLFTNYQYAFAVVYSILAACIGAFFLVFGIVAFRLLKKVSDVNLLTSSIIYYLVFIISLHLLIPISSVLDFSFMARSMAAAFRYYFVFVVNISVVFMDSRREEIKEMYVKCCGKAEEKIRKQSFSSVHSESLLSNNINESELNDASSPYYDASTVTTFDK